MRTPTFPWQLNGRRTGLRPASFVTRRLRHLIIIPYLILATLLAVTVTYLLTSAANQSLTDRFNGQLLDAVQRGVATLDNAKDAQVPSLRGIAFTKGFPEALAAKDRATLLALAEPQAVNNNLENVLVISVDGSLVLALSEPGTSSDSELSPELKALIESALNQQGARDNDVPGIANNSKGEAFLYTAGPVRQNNVIVGVVVVGNNLSQLLRRVGRQSLSDGATFYGPNGAPLGYSLIVSREVSLEPLPISTYNYAIANTGNRIPTRTITVGTETYVEALGPVTGPGVQGKPLGVFGVMLRTQTLDARLQDTLWAMLPIFALAMALTVLIGLTLANWIDRPLTQLMIASGRVARGDLEAKVPITRNDELGVLTARFNDMVDGLRQLLFVKDLFGRFVSREVSAKLLAGQIELGGEQREVTVLFSDIRDFTRLSEERSPSEIVDLLNEYFRNVVMSAGRHGGIVNKFGGDSTMIVFGAPVDMPDHADRALATALEIDQALKEMSAYRQAKGWKALRQGIGINTGTVVAGQIGSEDRMEYTVIGDAVNVASRLQAMNKTIKDCDIVFSESTLDALANPGAWVWESKGQTRVRGKHEEVSIYSLLGRSGEHDVLEELEVDDLLIPPPAEMASDINEVALEASSVSR